jgi:hypothetical protein
MVRKTPVLAISMSRPRRDRRCARIQWRADGQGIPLTASSPPFARHPAAPKTTRAPDCPYRVNAEARPARGCNRQHDQRAGADSELAGVRPQTTESDATASSSALPGHVNGPKSG